MKKTIVTIFLILLYLISLSDVGNAYRYKATFKIKDCSEVTRYFYFPTYKEKFDSTQWSFNEYIESYYHFLIRVFEELKTRERNEFLVIDFSIDGSEIKIE